MASHEKLRALEEELRARGADGARLELVRRARLFKRSWVDMADALTTVRKHGLYKKWGYADFHAYCATELLLTSATVDKLTGSFAVVQQHAPQVLQRDGLAQPMPSIDAVEYFAKAIAERDGGPVGDDDEDDGDDNVVELRRAVFDDTKSVAVLRRSFNPVFFPKPEGQEEIDALEKTRSTARRLEGLLQRVDGLDEKLVDALQSKLATLREDVDALLLEARKAQETQQAS